MKTVFRITVVTMILGFLLIADIPRLPVQLVPDAEAIFGVRRRAFRRGVIIGGSFAAAGAAAHQSSAAVCPAAGSHCPTAVGNRSATISYSPATIGDG